MNALERFQLGLGNVLVGYGLGSALNGGDVRLSLALQLAGLAIIVRPFGASRGIEKMRAFVYPENKEPAP